MLLLLLLSFSCFLFFLHHILTLLYSPTHTNCSISLNAQIHPMIFIVVATATATVADDDDDFFLFSFRNWIDDEELKMYMNRMFE